VPRRDLAQGSEVAGWASWPVGLSGRVTITEPIRLPAARAVVTARASAEGVADAAFARRDGHEVGAGTGERGLGGVANPARLGHRDVGTDGEQQGEQ
jgi:hypothetical protein